VGEWQLASDLEQQLVFPAEIVATTLRPDIVIWSVSLKSVVLIELTVPLETNKDVAHERKLRRYEKLVAQCRERGWQCELFAVEVGARGFVSGTALSLLRRVGFRGRRCQKALRELAGAAEAGSFWIWQKHMQEALARSPEL